LFLLVPDFAFRGAPDRRYTTLALLLGRSERAQRTVVVVGGAGTLLPTADLGIPHKTLLRSPRRLLVDHGRSYRLVLRDPRRFCGLERWGRDGGWSEDLYQFLLSVGAVELHRLL
jgi:hypothetical protein